MEDGSTKPRVCPECGSERLCRDGIRYLTNGETIQRWLCKECGRRFSETSFNNSNHLQHVQKIHSQILNSPEALPSYCQGSGEATQSRAPTSHGGLVQTLAEVENPSKSGLAGATLRYNLTSEIVNLAFWLRRQGYSDATTKSRVRRLRRLVTLGANLHDPESVKEIISKQKGWSLGYKETMAEAYSSYLNMVGGRWNPPRYKRVPKLPHIPLEKEIDQLIACFPPKMACLLQLLKETGCRIGEAVKLTWRDVDLETGTVRITPEKGSEPRIFRMSSVLQAMFKRMQPQTMDGKIFPSQSCVEAYYYRRRKQAANRLCNPRLLQISLHTFRHWKATMEYAKTKDILHVMKILGHKNINNTLIYTQLVNFNDNEFTCKAAATSKEAEQLIEAGFDYVCTAPDGIMLFKKRK